MSILSMCIFIIVLVFAISALSGVIAFFIDIIRYPQLKKKIEVTPSAELTDQSEEDNEEGLILDENIEIDL